MSLRTDRVQLEIILQADNARKEILSLEDTARKLEREMKKLDKSSQEYIDRSRQLSQVRTRMQELRNQIGLTGVSLKELNQRQRELNIQLRNLDPRTEKYRELQAELQRVNARIRELRVGAQATESAFNKFTNGFNKYFSLAATAAATVTGISYTFRKLAEEVAVMDDIYADVRKTTGLTVEEIRELNEEFKKMDTRTSREQLNALARDAGKLGIATKEEVMQFVRAANQIDVALGEDLGEGAIRNIGKMADVFGETKKLGIEKAYLSIGSAINELGQSSTASEAYLVNFTQRLGGVAAQAGISIQDILGYASALDQSGQAVEMSATALQKFIMKIFDEPAKFAKMAGMEVKSFSDLLQKDANKAIITVLKSLNEKGGFQQLIPVFKEMGLDGARSVGVLSALAERLEAVTEAQEISNTAFAEATSLTKEYQVKNETLAAQLDKAKKAFKDNALILGEKLNPILLKSTNYITYLVKALVEIIKWYSKYGGIVNKLVVVILAYVAAVKLQTLWEGRATQASILSNTIAKAKVFWTKASTAATYLYGAALSLLSGNIKGATYAFRIFTAAIRANPIGLIASAVIALGMALYALYKKLTGAQNKYTISVKDLVEAEKQLSGQIAKEKQEINNLVSAITHANTSQETRLKLIRQLKQNYPDYLKYLDAEKLSNEELLVILEKVNTAYLLKFKTAPYQAKIDAYGKQIVDMQSRKLEVENELNELVQKGILPNSKDEKRWKELNDENVSLIKGIHQSEAEVKKLMQEVNKLNNEFEKSFSAEGIVAEYSEVVNAIEVYRERLAKAGSEEEADYYAKEMKRLETKRNLLQKQVAAIQKEREKATAKKDAPELAVNPDELKKQYDEALKLAEEAHNQKKAALMKQRADNLTSEKEYRVLLEQTEKEFLNKQLALQKQYGQFTSKTEQKIQQKRLNELAQGLKEIDEVYKLQQVDLQEQRAKKVIDEEVYNLALLVAEKDHLQKKKAYLEEHKMDTADIRKQIADNELKQYDILLTKESDYFAKQKLKFTKENAAGLISDHKYKYLLLSQEMTFLEEKLKLQKEYGLKNIQTLQEIADLQKEINKHLFGDTEDLETGLDEQARKLNDYRQQLNDENDEYRLKSELELLNDLHAAGLMSEQEYVHELTRIWANYIEEKAKKAQQFVNLAGDLNEAMSAADHARLERDKEIALTAAGEDAEKREAIEKEYAQKKLDLDKKQADTKFAMQVAQIIANTAVAIMQGYAQLGPIGGSIAAVMLAATGAAQIAKANAERQRVKAMTLDNSSAGGGIQGERVVLPEGVAPKGTTKGYSEGGYTGTGERKEVAGIVHRGEYVVPAPELRRPEVFNFVKSIENIRRQRTSINPLPGFAEGGYTGGQLATPAGGSALDTALIQGMYELLSDLKQNGVKTEFSYSKFEKGRELLEKSRKKGSLG